MKSDRVNWWLTVSANVGVLVGLIFVGLEVRNSTDAVTAQTADSVADGYNTINLVAMEDPAISRILYLGVRHPDRLNDLDAYRFSLLVRSYFNQYRRVHRLYRVGLLPESEWIGYATEIARFVDTPGVRLYVAGNPLPEQFAQDIKLSAFESSNVDYTLGREPLDIE